ncbi:MAG: exosome complex protein Rrp42 [Candidatus Altiarchaeota archaeon]
MTIEHYLRRDYIANIVTEGRRVDGRAFDQYRPIEITKDYVKEKADGSAYVTLGNTKVLVGVSLDIGEPYPDSPESGILATGTELRPIASPDFELGPPREDSIEIARVVDRGLRESGLIDLEKLFIEEDKVWAVFVDIHALDYDGNLIDASTLAAVTSLLNTKIPKIEDGKIVRGEWSGKLPTTCTPIACTLAKVTGKMLLDPTLDEEHAMDARLTVTTTDTVNAMQKGGMGTLTMEEVERSVDIAFEKAKELRQMVESA